MTTYEAATVPSTTVPSAFVGQTFLLSCVAGAVVGGAALSAPVLLVGTIAGAVIGLVVGALFSIVIWASHGATPLRTGYYASAVWLVLVALGAGAGICFEWTGGVIAFVAGWAALLTPAVGAAAYWVRRQIEPGSASQASLLIAAGAAAMPGVLAFIIVIVLWIVTGIFAV